MSRSSTLTLVAVFVVGLLIGGAAVAGVGTTLPTDETRSPTASMTTSTGTVPENATLPASWIAQVPASDESMVVLNYTYTHEASSLDHRIAVGETAPGEYVVNVSATPVDDGKADPPAGQVSRTHVEAVASLPSDYDAVTVRFDGRDLATLSNPGSSIEFHPVNASRADSVVAATVGTS